MLSSEAAGGPAHSKNQNQWRVRHGVVSVIGSDLDAVGFVTQNFTHPNAVYHCFFCQRSESPRVCGVNKNPRAEKKKNNNNSYLYYCCFPPESIWKSYFFFLKTPKFGRFQELGTSKKLRFLSLPARSREADRMASVTPERAAGVGSQWWNGYVTLDSAIYIISYYNIHLYTIIYYYMYLYVIITWD